MIIYADRALWVSKLIATLEEGPVHIVVCSRKVGLMLEDILTELGYSVLFINQMSNDDPDRFKDIDYTVQNYDVLMATSTVNVGIDIQCIHFRTQFVYATYRSNCAREVTQMIGRVRHLDSKTTNL